MSATAATVSIVVPSYDEEECIGETVRVLSEWLERDGRCGEIVVVDDGSSDATTRRAREAASGLATRVQVLRYSPNRGKGFALKVGFAATRGSSVLFTDADLSTPVDDARRLLDAVADGADVAIGSRRQTGAQIEIHQPWWRERMGKVFTGLVRLFFVDVSDATCGCKAFEGEAGRDLFARVRVPDWAFDVEILWLATRRGLRLQEVPVHWADRPGTKVRLLRDVTRSLLGLARIRWIALRAGYDTPAPAEATLEHWANGPQSGERRGEGASR